MKTFLGKCLLFVIKCGPLSPLPGKEIKHFAVTFQELMSLLSAGCSGTFHYVRRWQSSFYSEYRCVQIKITFKVCVLMYIKGATQ